MLGMDRYTGKPLDGIAHLRQSVLFILTTKIGSWPGHRPFGAAILDLVDAPANRQLEVEVYARVVDALYRWEPRLQVNRVTLSPSANGDLAVDIYATVIETGQPLNLQNAPLAFTA